MFLRCFLVVSFDWYGLWDVVGPALFEEIFVCFQMSTRFQAECAYMSHM